MPYRLFVTDLDGTVLGRDLALSARTREAFARLTARGCTVAIATGRMLGSATPFWRELALTAPLITYNGAWVHCLASGTTIAHRPVPEALVAEVVAALEAAGLHVNLYLEDRVHACRRSPEAERYMAHARVEAVWLPGWEAIAGRAPTKILAIGPEARIEAALAALRPRWAGRLHLTQSMPTFLEITSAEVHKASALARLAAHLGVAREEVVAVGDGMNDAEMLAWAHLGVAMATGPAALRAVADRVTPGVEEDGVAQLVDALIAEGRV